MTRLSARVVKLEAYRNVATPTIVMSMRPLGPGEASAMLGSWRAHVAAGAAGVMGRALVLRDPPLTSAEWLARFAPAGARP